MEGKFAVALDLVNWLRYATGCTLDTASESEAIG